MLAEEIGVGHTTVQRVWKEHGLKPHLTLANVLPG